MTASAQITFDPTIIPKQFVFPHSKSVYAQKINNNFLDSSALPCFTNTHKVSPIKLGRKKHKKYCEKYFAKYSDTKKRGRYLHFNSKYNQKLFFNNKTGQYSIFKENLAKNYKEDFILTTMLWNQVEKEAKKRGLVGIFFTATVVGDLHPFGAKDSIVRANFDYELNFKYAYKELQQLHKDIRIQANRTLKYAPSFFKATEYHKTYIPHSHTVYFVKPEDINKFLNIVENKTELNADIGRTDTQVLNKIGDNYAVPYLLKYLQKTAQNMDNKELKVFDGWKRALGIKQLYSNSKLTLSKWVIKKARYYFAELTLQGEINKDYWKNNYNSLYDCIRANVKVIDKTYDIENNLLRNKIIEPLGKEKIRMERDRTMLLKFINVNNEPFLLNTTYKNKKMLVKRINKYSECVLYNKKHYKIIKMRENACSSVSIELKALIEDKERKEKSWRRLLSFLIYSVSKQKTLKN